MSNETLRCYENRNCVDKNCDMCAYNLNITKAYHMTNVENVESVLRDGLRCELGRNGKYVYLSSTPKNGFGEVEFEVNIDGLELCPLSDWELVSSKDISVDRIKIVI